MRILVVEDEALLADGLVELLTDHHYAVDLARDGHSAAELAELSDYDLVVLDWSLPGKSGLELLRSWRRSGRTWPVLMLTARAGREDVVGGLDTGADDYLTKPFSPEILLARVRSLMRRRERPLQGPLKVADVEMDRASRRVTVAGRRIELSPKEFSVLEYFLRHAGEVVSRTDLTEHVWDSSFDAMSNVVDAVVYRLRKKIDDGAPARLLHTVKGVGYVLRRVRA